MSTTNNMLDIISAIDQKEEKNSIIEELSNPKLGFGFRPTVIRLLGKMVDLGFIKDDGSFLVVTSKGKEFYENTPFEDL